MTPKVGLIASVNVPLMLVTIYAKDVTTHSKKVIDQFDTSALIFKLGKILKIGTNKYHTECLKCFECGTALTSKYRPRPEGPQCLSCAGFE